MLEKLQASCDPYSQSRSTFGSRMLRVRSPVPTTSRNGQSPDISQFVWTRQCADADILPNLCQEFQPVNESTATNKRKIALGRQSVPLPSQPERFRSSSRMLASTLRSLSDTSARLLDSAVTPVSPSCRLASACMPLSMASILPNCWSKVLIWVLRHCSSSAVASRRETSETPSVLR